MYSCHANGLRDVAFPGTRRTCYILLINRQFSQSTIGGIRYSINSCTFTADMCDATRIT